MPMAYCRVLLCNINKKSSCCNGGFLFISNKHLVTFHFPLAIYHILRIFHQKFNSKSPLGICGYSFLHLSTPYNFSKNYKH